MGIRNKITGRFARGLAVAIALIYFNPSFAGFFTTTPATSSLSTADLNRMFNEGIGPMAGWAAGTTYLYPFPTGGVFGAPQYNGCYDSKLNRLDDLQGNTCAHHNGEASAVYELVLGFQMECYRPDYPVPGICGDVGIVMNCRFQKTNEGTSAFDRGNASENLCAQNNGIVRRARAASVTVPPPGCDFGQFVSGGTCAPCANGWYKNSFSTATTCSPCSDKVIAHVATSPVTFNTTITGNTGAISADECSIHPLDPWTCAAGYEKEPGNQFCVRSCAMTFEVTPKGPSVSGGTNGWITATTATPIGTVTNFRIESVSPTPAYSAAATSSPTMTFTGLTNGTYTLRAVDTEAATGTVCNETSTVTLAVLPPCTLAAGSVTSVPPSNPPSNNNGTATVNYSGATGPVTISMTPATGVQTLGTNSVSYTGLQYGSYVVNIQDDLCTASANINFTTPPACGLSLGAPFSVINPSTAVSNDGSFAITAAGAAGAVSFSLSPAIGSVTNGGTTASMSLLSAGSYTVTAFDAGVPGCSASQTVTLSSVGPPCTLTLLETSTTNPTSGVSTDGAVTITQVGAVGAVSFSYAPLTGSLATTATTATLTNVPIGTYTFTATDAGVVGCSATRVVNLVTGPPTYVECSTVTCSVNYVPIFAQLTQDLYSGPGSYCSRNFQSSLFLPGVNSYFPCSAAFMADPVTWPGFPIVAVPIPGITAGSTAPSSSLCRGVIPTTSATAVLGGSNGVPVVGTDVYVGCGYFGLDNGLNVGGKTSVLKMCPKGYITLNAQACTK